MSHQSRRQQQLKKQEEAVIDGFIREHTAVRRYIEKYSEPGMDQTKLNALIATRNWYEAQLAKRGLEIIY